MVIFTILNTDKVKSLRIGTILFLKVNCWLCKALHVQTGHTKLVSFILAIRSFLAKCHYQKLLDHRNAAATTIQKGYYLCVHVYTSFVYMCKYYAVCLLTCTTHIETHALIHKYSYVVMQNTVLAQRNQAFQV